MAHFVQLPPALRRTIDSWLQKSSLRNGEGQCEDREGLLEQEKSDTTPSNVPRWHAFRNVRVRRYLSFVGIALIISFLFAWAFQIRSQSQTTTGTRPRIAQTLQILIPTPNLPTELCQTVLSAEVLHYSTTTLVRWDGVAKEPRENAQRRMTAVRNHLEKLRKRNENDTVILLDSVSSWFQLRPEVLLKRYYEINRRGDQRLASRVGVEVMEEEGIRQSVVFAASATCAAASAINRTECSHVPESSLAGASAGTSAPRHLDHALVIGTAKSVHEVYRRAVAVIERADVFESEQAIFADILYSQERYRQSLRPKTQTWSERFRGWFSGKYAHGPLASRNSTTHHVKLHANEFGIGLDYAGELSLATTDEPESFTWTQHGEEKIAEDIRTSMPPFWSTSGDQNMPIDKTWSDLRLLTNANTNAVPAVVQHNMTSTDSSLRKKLWEDFWLSSQSRNLLDAYMTVPAMPLASVIDNDGVEQVFWSTTIGRAGVKVSDGSWLGWKEFCGNDSNELADEIFGDGLGEWKSKLP